MNWNKLSQVIVPQTKYDGPAPYASTIGHGDYNIKRSPKDKSIKQEWLWILQDGQFKVDIAKGTASHAKLYETELEMNWKGRAEELKDGTVNVSVIGPWSQNSPDLIPKSILSSIRSQWGAMANVYKVY